MDVSPHSKASRYSDLDRPPLSAGRLRQALIVPGGLWSAIEVKDETGSTNADVARAARQGAAEGLVVVADRQSAGRGRLGRRWESPPRAGLAVSLLLRPPAEVPVGRYGWLPLLAGVALVETVRRLGAVDAVLKWPNDLLIGERKCAGILSESVPNGGAQAEPVCGGGSAEGRPGQARRSRSSREDQHPQRLSAGVVLGMGLNVSLRADELPVPQATSLALAGSACTDRDPLLRALLRDLAAWYRRFTAAYGDSGASGLREAYLLHCATVGRRVHVALPSGTSLSGTASDVDSDGRLVLTDDAGESTAVSAGDVQHVSTLKQFPT